MLSPGDAVVVMILINNRQHSLLPPLSSLVVNSFPSASGSDIKVFCGFFPSEPRQMGSVFSLGDGLLAIKMVMGQKAGLASESGAWQAVGTQQGSRSRTQSRHCSSTARGVCASS